MIHRTGHEEGGWQESEAVEEGEQTHRALLCRVLLQSSIMMITKRIGRWDVIALPIPWDSLQYLRMCGVVW